MEISRINREELKDSLMTESLMLDESTFTPE